MKTNERNFGLDLIRVIAISLVLFSHMALLITPNQHESGLFFIKFFGALGVDIFFVLSGFLIGGILLKHINSKGFNKRTILYFWIRRWFRTLPNYFLILVVNIIISYLFLEQDFPYWKYLFFIQNFSSAQPDFFTESWSLSIEEFAYILVPFILLLIGLTIKRITEKTFLIVTFAAIILLFFVKLNYHLGDIEIGETWSGSFRKVVMYRLDSIYYGFVAAYLHGKYLERIDKFKLTLLGISAVLFVVVHGIMYTSGSDPDEHLLFFNTFYLPLLSVTILLLFPFMMHLKASKTVSKIVTHISKTSYALYLVNYSIVLLTMERIFKVDTEILLHFKVLIAFLFLLISYLLAVILYRFYEKPMMDLRDHRKIRRLLSIKS
ncbi:MAG: acyltransferase family protein [Jejuia sp.]